MFNTSTGQDGPMAPVVVRVYKEIPNDEKHLKNWLTRSYSVFGFFFGFFSIAILVELQSHFFLLYNS